MVFATNEWDFVASGIGLDGRQARSIEFPCHPGVDAALFITGDGIELGLVSSVDFAAFDDRAAASLANLIIDRFSYHFGIALDSPTLCASRRMDGRFFSSVPLLRRIVRSVPDEDALSDFAQVDWKNLDPRKALAYRLFRESLAATDSIASFFMLWNLLVMIEGSDQEADRRVRDTHPDMRLYPGRRRGQTVSEVRDVRDDIAHMVSRPAYRTDPSVSVLRSRVDETIDSLTDSIRAAVSAADWA